MSNIIIGKNSNLTTKLLEKDKFSIAISSREVLKSLNIISKYKNEEINIVFNNFQPATRLNLLSNTEEYVTNSILVTAKVLDYFKDIQINKIIYTSSSSVYGNNILCNENDELKAMNTPNVSGEIFCIGTSKKVSINNLVNVLNNKYSKNIKANYLESRNGDIKESICDNKKIKKYLEINEFMEFNQGIMKI